MDQITKLNDCIDDLLNRIDKKNKRIIELNEQMLETQREKDEILVQLKNEEKIKKHLNSQFSEMEQKHKIDEAHDRRGKKFFPLSRAICRETILHGIT